MTTERAALPLPIQASGNGGASSAAAALKGANLAFQKQVAAEPKPAPPAAKLKDGGALKAATSASRDQSLARSPSRRTVTRLSQDTTGGSIQDGGYARDLEHGAVSQRLSQYLAGSTGSQTHLHPPRRGVDTKSPSYIAATLAASRSASPSPQSVSPGYAATPASNPPRVRRKGSTGTLSVAEGFDFPDTSSLEPTRNLISMFDREGDLDPVKRGDEAVRRKGTRQKQRAPTPQRVGSPDGEAAESVRTKAVSNAKLRSATPPQIVRRAPTDQISSPAKTEDPRTETKNAGMSLTSDPPSPRRRPGPRPRQRPATPPQIVSRSIVEVLSPEPRRITSNPKLLPPVPPKPRGAKSKNKMAGPSTKWTRSQSSIAMHDGEAEYEDDGPAEASYFPHTAESVSTDDSFVSAASTQPSQASSSPHHRDLSRRPVSVIGLPSSPGHQLYGNQATLSSSNLPLQSLTNAIVAGSLASARLTPSNTGNSTLTPPALPARQKSPHLRQTLREPSAKSDNEDERRKKNPLAKLGPSNKHKHHEGSRRRWREEITERQRKRYESLWASNKGTLLDENYKLLHGRVGEDLSEFVVDVVVRELWLRSRLPRDELYEVWELVDRRKAHMLSKEEFVVGMWLIDQRLRGRKIPAKVSQSVWDSAKGLNVMSPKRKK